MISPELISDIYSGTPPEISSDASVNSLRNAIFQEMLGGFFQNLSLFLFAGNHTSNVYTPRGYIPIPRNPQIPRGQGTGILLMISPEIPEIHLKIW